MKPSILLALALVPACLTGCAHPHAKPMNVIGPYDPTLPDLCTRGIHTIDRKTGEDWSVFYTPGTDAFGAIPICEVKK